MSVGTVSDPMSKVVLVSGASSGVGSAIASLLSNRGYRVFGTSRKPSISPSSPFEMLELNVNSDDSVSRCVKSVVERAGHLDVLVNNAGSGIAGAIEETSIEQAKSVFETNLFGVMRLTKAVLPQMREQGGGKIINIGTAGGISASPFIGIYSASKFALEGFSEALRHEVKPFNIHVSIVEPSFVRNTNFGKSIQVASHLPAYDGPRDRVMKLATQSAANGSEPARVAETVASIIESPAPNLRYLMVERDTPKFTALRESERLEPMVRKFWQLDE